MNSFSELNGYSAELITFKSQADYTIAFGNSLGNGSVTANTSVFFTLQNRQPIISFTNPLEPLVVSIIAQPDLNGACIQSIDYVGTNANITITNPTAGAWVAQGMWTVADYNELFANGVVELPGLRTDDFVFETTVSDQLGNTRSFYTTVDVIPGGFSRPNTVSFDEDTTVQIDGLGFSDLANYNYTFTFDLVPTSAGNILINATSQQGNSNVVLTGSRTAINTVLQGNIAFIPADDYAANAVLAVNVVNNSTGNNLGYANIALQIAATHPDSSWPPAITYGRTGNIAFNVWTYGSSFEVLDQAVGKNYSLTFDMANTAIGNLYQGNTLMGSSVTLTGNKAAVNANIGNVMFVPNGISTANATLQFTQTQTTANIIQANVAIPMINQPVAQNWFDGGERDVGRYYYIPSGVPSFYGSTANTSFALNTWVATGNVYNYPSTLANTVTPAQARVTTGVKYSPTSIKITNNNGVFTTRPYFTTGNAVPETCYFACWFYSTVALNGQKMLSLANLAYPAAWPAGPSQGGNQVVAVQFWSGGGFVTNTAYLRTGEYFNQRLALGSFGINTWYHVAVQRAANGQIAAWVNGQPQTSAFSAQGLGNPGFSIPYLEGPAFNTFLLGRPNGPASDSIPIVAHDYLFDDIVYRDDNPYTPGVAFTPAPLGQFTGNIRMMMTGC